MHVAVTGASGFIGRHVVAELERRGIGATLLLRSPNMPQAAGSMQRRVAFDLHGPAQDIFERCGCPDTLIHLAWGGLPHYKSPHHLQMELPAHERFISAMVGSGLKKLLVAGTCFEYGMQSGALAEELLPMPDNAYGAAKNALRLHLEALQREFAFALTWARLFYLWGDGQAENSLWPSLCRAAAQGERLFPMSGGEQLRDYLPVTEAARLLASLALAQQGHGVVNVASGRPIAVRALVEGWIHQQGWSIEPELGRFPYPDYEAMAFWGDTSKLSRCLDLS